MKTIELFLAVNQDGDFYVDTDSADCAIGELQSNETCHAVRVMTISIKLDLPQPETINVAVAVPAQSQAPAEVTVS